MADVGSLMDELATALGAIEDLRVYAYAPSTITPPVAMVDYPESVTYDTTFQRGADSFIFNVWLVVGKADARSTRDRIAIYEAGAGSSSVKQAIEQYPSNLYYSARVSKANGASFTSAGVNYAAVVFSVEVIAPGGI